MTGQAAVVHPIRRQCRQCRPSANSDRGEHPLVLRASNAIVHRVGRTIPRALSTGTLAGGQHMARASTTCTAHVCNRLDDHLGQVAVK